MAVFGLVSLVDIVDILDYRYCIDIFTLIPTQVLGVLLAVNLVRNFHRAWGSGSSGRALAARTLGLAE